MAPRATTKAAVKTVAKATAAPVKRKADMQPDRTATLSAYMDSDSFGKMKEDILPNDYIEPQFATGSTVLDWSLGLNGGFHHRGRVVMFHGEEHTGKTTLALVTAAGFQRKYLKDPVVFWDYERTCKLEYAWACGLDPKRTRIIQPQNNRDSIRQTIAMIKAGACRCFIFDSINMMLPDRSEKDDKAFMAGRDDGEDPVAAHARFVQWAFREITKVAAHKEVMLIFINQQSVKIATTKADQRKMQWSGTVTNLGYTLKGGNAPKQFASYQVETSKGKAFIGAGDDEAMLFEREERVDDLSLSTRRNILRNHVRMIKNKVTGGGYREADIYLRPGGGIDDWISVREIASDKRVGLIAKIPGSNKYRVGTPQRELAVFPSKAACIDALVIKQDMSILVPLREMVIEEIKKNDAMFSFEPSARDKFNSGEMSEEQFLACSGGEDSALSDECDGTGLDDILGASSEELDSTVGSLGSEELG